MRGILRRLAGGLAAAFGLFTLASLIGAGAGWAAGKEYAYLRVQGSLTDRAQIRPLTGATIRLIGGSGVFEAVTDQRGAFVFEKLPIAPYEISVRRSDGEVVRDIRQVDLEVPQLNRFAIRFGKGEEQTAFIEASEKSVRVSAPEPAVHWRRFWTQFAIFLGCAGVLAL